MAPIGREEDSMAVEIARLKERMDNIEEWRDATEIRFEKQEARTREMENGVLELKTLLRSGVFWLKFIAGGMVFLLGGVGTVLWFFLRMYIERLF